MRCQSRQLYERYHKAVTAYCDKAEKQEDPHWRNSYYASALLLILFMSCDMDDCQELDPLPARVVVKTDHCPMASEPSATFDSTSTGEVFSSASSATESRSSAWSSRRDTNSYTLTSSTTVCTDSPSSPLLPGSPTSNEEILPCDCGETFSGTYRVSNYKRHRLNAGVHTSAGLECPEPECDVKCSRSDNLRTHFKRKHPYSEYPELQQKGALKRRRDTQDELGPQVHPTELS